MNDRTNDISFLLQLKGVLHAHFDITLCFTENKTIITSNNYFSWVKYTNNLHALRLAHSFPHTHGPARRSSMNEHLVLGPCKRKNRAQKYKHTTAINRKIHQFWRKQRSAENATEFHCGCFWFVCTFIRIEVLPLHFWFCYRSFDCHCIYLKPLSMYILLKVNGYFS